MGFEKEGFRLIEQALRDIEREIRELKETLRGVQVAVIEQHADSKRRQEHLEAQLLQHSSRIREIEQRTLHGSILNS